jgi:cysteinyl-tRNA synthetase
LNFISEAKSVLFELSNILALDLTTKTHSGPITADAVIVNVEELIKKRNDAKKNRNFDEADEIRKNLEAKGIILEDTKDGTTWRKKI